MIVGWIEVETFVAKFIGLTVEVRAIVSGHDETFPF